MGRVLNMDKLQHFKQLEGKYDDDLNNWRGKQAELKSQLLGLYEEQKNVTELYYDPCEKGSLQDVNRVKVKIENAQRQLKEVEERIATVEKRKLERLQALLPDIQTEFVDVTYKEAMAKMGKEVVNIRRMKADFLLELARIYRMGNEARWEHNQIEQISRKYGKPYGLHVDMPIVNMTNTYWGSDKCNAPLQSEIEMAYRQGTVPRWVYYYAKTGEVLFDDMEAIRKCKQIEQQEQEGVQDNG